MVLGSRLQAPRGKLRADGPNHSWRWRFVQNAIYSQRARARAATSPVLPVYNSCCPGAKVAFHLPFPGAHDGLVHLRRHCQKLASAWDLWPERQRDFSHLYPAAGISCIPRRDLYPLRHGALPGCSGGADVRGHRHLLPDCRYHAPRAVAARCKISVSAGRALSFPCQLCRRRAHRDIGNLLHRASPGFRYCRRNHV